MRASLSLLPFLVAATATCSPIRPVERKIAPTAGQCAAKGAFLDYRGMFGTAMCVTRFPDAGKACSDKSDCSGRCITEDERFLTPAAIGNSARGLCQPDDSLFGCYAEVVNGRIAQPICAD